MSIESEVGVEFGAKCRDRATGYEGTVVGIWLNFGGPTQVSLARLGADGKVVETFFDLGRVEQVNGASGLGFSH